MTEDHPILAERGWVPAGQLTPCDKIATGTPGLSAHQLAGVIGMLLGDATIAQRSLALGHCVAQLQYLSYKAQLLANLNRRSGLIRTAAVYDDRHRNTYYRAWWASKCLPVIGWLTSFWYDSSSGKKVIPRALLHHSFTDFSLAIWYMDDGGLQGGGGRPFATFATNGFSRTDVEFLATLLQQHGLQCHLRCQPNSYPGYKISLSRTATRELSRRISRFVPPCLRYKLIPEFATDPFDANWYATSPQTFWDFAVVAPARSLRTFKTHRGGETVYCLDVEDTHNFVTRGGVVHNCLPPKDASGSHIPPAASLAACRDYLDRTIELLQPHIIVPLGATALGRFLPLRSSRSLKSPITISESHGHAYWQSDRWVFPMYHPAWELRSRRPQWAKDLMERDIRRLEYLLRVDLATRTHPWPTSVLTLLAEPRAQLANTPAEPNDNGDTKTSRPLDHQTQTRFPDFLETADGQYMARADFVAFITRAAALDPVSGNTDPAPNWLHAHGFPVPPASLTPDQVSAALRAATAAIAAAKPTPPPRIALPVVRNRGGLTTVIWDTDGLHPMFRTPTAIDELMRRATGLSITRMNDLSTTGTVTAIAPTDHSPVLEAET